MRRTALSLLVLCAGVLAGCGGAASTRTDDPAANPRVVALYGGQTLTLDEFESEYARSIGSRDAAADSSTASYQDFLRRYVDFRLKVMAARDAGLDRDPGLRAEVDDYRLQLARPYLLQKEVTEPLLRQLYERSQQTVEASHILIRVDENAQAADTLAAYERAIALRDSVEAGADFAALARRHSDDPSAQRPNGPGAGGYLGVFGAGRMVQAFEDKAYETPVGTVSMPFRTRFGYHLINVHDRREKPDDVRISHLMVRVDAPTPADSAVARARIDSLRQVIVDGADFAAMADEHSADRQTGPNGGDLGFIPYDARLVPALKDAAFALDNVGDVSPVVESEYGFHLIQLTGRRSLKSYEEARAELEGQLARLPRSELARKAYLAERIAAHGTTIDTAFVERVIGDLQPADLHERFRADSGFTAAELDHVVATLGDSSYTLRRLGAFLADSEMRRQRGSAPQGVAFVDRFFETAVLDYEVHALETRDADFRRTMREFNDGLLLFRIMEDSVWTPAAADTSALEAYWAQRRGAYRYGDRTRVVSFTAIADSMLVHAGRLLDEGLSPEAVQERLGEEMPIGVDTTYVSGPTGSHFDRALALDAGQRTEPFAKDRLFQMLLNAGVDPAREKTFEEARPQVIADYQEVLEARMLEALRARYGARVFPERVAVAFEGEASAAAADAR